MASSQLNMIKKVFDQLKAAGYYFQTKTPDQLIRLRKSHAQVTDFEKNFGLGLPTDEPCTIAVSSDLDGEYLVHDHWPPKAGAEEDYVHLGAESFHIVRELEKSPPVGKSVVDLGCSSGVLSFEAAKKANYVLGIDSSKRAISFAEQTKQYRGLNRVEFMNLKINLDEDISIETEFDLAIFNPPLAIPHENQNFPHRDGGKLGIELPLLFLDFAQKHLKSNGEAWFIVGDPVISGKDQFGAELKKRPWKILEEKIIEPYFNQSVAKDHGYAEHGITQIKLKFYKLQLNA